MLLTGCGIGIAFTSSITIPSLYFRKYRLLAQGISISGVAVGTVGLTLLVRVYTDVYGWRGAMLIVAGLTTHLFLCAVVMWPVKWQEVLPEDDVSIKPTVAKVKDQACEATVMENTNEAECSQKTCEVQVQELIEDTSEATVVEETPRAKVMSYPHEVTIKIISENGSETLVGLNSSDTLHAGPNMKSCQVDRRLLDVAFDDNHKVISISCPCDMDKVQVKFGTPLSREDHASSVQYVSKSMDYSWHTSISSGIELNAQIAATVKRKAFDFDIFQSVDFVAYCVALIFMNIALSVYFTFLPAMAMSFGTDALSAANLIAWGSVAGERIHAAMFAILMFIPFTTYVTQSTQESAFSNCPLHPKYFDIHCADTRYNVLLGGKCSHNEIGGVDIIFLSMEDIVMF